jgi:hypothetical protein
MAEFPNLPNRLDSVSLPVLVQIHVVHRFNLPSKTIAAQFKLSCYAW